MENVKKFLKIDTDYGSDYDFNSSYDPGYGSGYGCGSGSGYGSSYGYGDGSGYGSGYDDGDGDDSGYDSAYGSGSGYGCGSGSGYGSSYGYGDGSGYGCAYGYGSGYGCGSGYGSSYGDGSGYGDDIKSFDNQTVYLIDSTQTIISSIKGNIAKGFILNNDLTLTECYIVKENNQFAHGRTLHEAFESLQEKLQNTYTDEERISKFNSLFPDYSKKYPAKDLFNAHNLLTGSCKFGRESFCKSNNINLSTDMFTIYEFIELTKNQYNGDIIKMLSQ